MKFKKVITWILAVFGAGLILFFGVVFYLVHQQNSRDASWKLMCGNNLREIAKSGMIYADSWGARLFPFGDGSQPSAAESLNVMVRFYGSARKLSPRLFICPASQDAAAVPHEDQTYTLTADNLSYAWTSKKLSPTVLTWLAADKHWRGEYEFRKPGHIGGMNVVNTDASVEWIPAAELDPKTGLPIGLTR